MVTQYEMDPAIERWHEEFERVRHLWINWCETNIIYCESASEAWLAFLEEMQQQRVQLHELKADHFLNPGTRYRRLSGRVEAR
ncbi:MAG: hypothetical protein FOGNACKC_02284 [Anaerolineae bacterium]|nr:hypothetical protein [Anaerolineae bacterium]